MRKYNNFNLLTSLAARNLSTTSRSVPFSCQSLAKFCLKLFETKRSNFCVWPLCNNIHKCIKQRRNVSIICFKEYGWINWNYEALKRLQKLFNYIYKTSFKHTLLQWKTNNVLFTSVSVCTFFCEFTRVCSCWHVAGLAFGFLIVPWRQTDSQWCPYCYNGAYGYLTLQHLS